MELNELNDLETKAIEIVATLGELEQEIAEYKNKNMETGEALDKISQLADTVKTAAENSQQQRTPSVAHP